MHQPLRPCRKAEQALAGLLLDCAGPGSELIVAERVDVRPTRQMPVLAGLGVLKGAPDMSGAMALIDYLT